MIKVLHFYPADDQLISQYVDMLCSAMQNYANVKAEHSLQAFTKALQQQQPDIVHLHGCWRAATSKAAQKALKWGARIVLSPHGQLEPWIMHQHFWRDKLPKLLTYQKHVVRQAYAIIVMGRMEEKCMKKLKYNPRIETVRNALITETITQEEMGLQVHNIYRKVLDSDPRPLMDEKTVMAVRAFIKTGLTGAPQWLSPDEYDATCHINEENWRKILLYAHQEHIDKTIKAGIAYRGLEVTTDFNPEEAAHYLPTHFDDAIRAIDIDGKNDTERLVKTMRSTKKLARNHHLTIMHMVALADILRNTRADEEKVARRLDDHKLTVFTQRIMAVLADLTGLEEGFMPLPQLEDKQAYHIEQEIIKHLEIT